MSSDHSTLFQSYLNSCHESKKYLEELKEILVVKRNRLSMNQNVHSAPACSETRPQ